MKKQWFRTTDLVDEKFIEEADPTRGVTPLHKKRIITTLVATAACLALTLTGLWLFLPKGETPPGQNTPPKDTPPSMEQNNYQAVIEKLSVLKESYDSQLKEDGVLIENVVPGMRPITGVPDAVPPGATPDGSTNDDSTYEEITDNQVEGITEADRIKRSSTHIFYLYGDTLWVFNIAGANSDMVGWVDLYSTRIGVYHPDEELYLSADCKTVTVIRPYHDYTNKKIVVRITSVDVSDPTNPTVKNNLEVSGSYLSSRVVDGKILLMTQHTLNQSAMDFEKEETFLPQVNGKSIPSDCIIVPEQVEYARYTVALKLDEATLAIEGQSAALSYDENIYVSQNYIFLTRSFADKPEDKDLPTIYKTEITALSYKDTFEKKGSVSVCGLVKDQWSMDEYEGILRVVTTTQNFVYGEYPTGDKFVMPNSGASSASLYCVDLKEFKVVASVENFAPKNETVQSVRFDKTSAYVCTAIVFTDPVFFFDLSDLNNITYKETGNIDGFSSSLINMGNGYLLGIGQENGNTFKAEIYRETETGVEGFSKYLRQNADYSTDYKSYYIDRENQLIGLGLYDLSYRQYSRYILLHFNGQKLELLLDEELSGTNEIKRSVYIDGFLYMLGEDGLRVVDVNKSGETTPKIKTIYDVAKLDNIPCDTALEFFWEDRENSYYFPCIKSQYIKVVYQDGTSEDIVTALKAGNATIRDLDQYDIEFYVKSKEP